MSRTSSPAASKASKETMHSASLSETGSRPSLASVTTGLSTGSGVDGASTSASSRARGQKKRKHRVVNLRGRRGGKEGEEGNCRFHDEADDVDVGCLFVCLFVSFSSAIRGTELRSDGRKTEFSIFESSFPIFESLKDRNPSVAVYETRPNIPRIH